MVGSAKTEKDADKSLTSYARQKSRVNKAQLCNDLKSGKRYCFLVTQAPLLRNLYACKALQGQVIAFDELRSSTPLQNPVLYPVWQGKRRCKTGFCMQRKAFQERKYPFYFYGLVVLCFTLQNLWFCKQGLHSLCQPTQIYQIYIARAG